MRKQVTSLTKNCTNEIVAPLESQRGMAGSTVPRNKSMMIPHLAPQAFQVFEIFDDGVVIAFRCRLLHPTTDF